MIDYKSIFQNNNVIAVVGMSRDPKKDAHSVPAFMKSNGYTVIPVNPFASEILGLKVYKTLAEVAEKIDIVNVFRPSDETLDVVQQAVKRHQEKGDIKVIWLQQGIVNEEAKKVAFEAGIEFIQDACIRVAYNAYIGL